MNTRLQSTLGWIAVGISALLGAFLGLFAGGEGAADGGGPLLAHLSQLLVVVLLSVAAVRWPRAGGAVLVLVAVAVAVAFRFNIGGAFLFAPLAIAGILYFLSRPQPRRVAYILLVAIPLGFVVLTALSVVMARLFS